MAKQTSPFDVKMLEEMNQKAIRNQFFTPDYCYIDLGLFKDFSLGAIFMETIVIKDDEALFNDIQQKLASIVPEYQKRTYDTVEPFLEPLGYKDADVDELLSKTAFHDYIFMMAPATRFLNMLIRHVIQNQNHSKPAEKFVKKKIDKSHYVLEAIDITFRINTYPLTLSEGTMANMAREFGELFGVNIEFMNKNPELFDKGDWDEWMNKVDCYYFDSLSRFQNSPFVLKQQENMEFRGTWFYARKRFERAVIIPMRNEDFHHQIQLMTAQFAMFCDFEWMQNNDLRLTEEAEDVPMTDEQDEPETTSSSGTES